MDGLLFSTGMAEMARPRIQAHLNDLVDNWDSDKTIQTLYLLVGLFIAHRIAISIYNLWFHPLSKIPGPTHLAIAYWPWLYQSHISGTFAKKSLQLHRKYGPVVRIGPNHIAVDGAIAWPEVFSHKISSKTEFPKVPDYFFKGDAASLIGAPKDTHRRQRRQLGHAFSDAALRDQEGVIMKYVDLMMNSFSKVADTSKIVNAIDLVIYTTVDIIGDLSFSESFHCLENNGYHPWVHSMVESIRGNSFSRFLQSYPLFGIIVQTFGLSKSIKAEIRNRNYVNEKTAERMREGNRAVEGRRDFLAYMLKENKDGEIGFQPQEIFATTPILIGAGSETTATTLSGLFFYLSQHPAAYKRLTDEIRSQFASEDDISMQSTAGLEYLHACIEETLRVYPPANETPPRLCPGATIAGRYIPAGTQISVYQWATFRNPEHWAEPDSYIPERWLPKTHPLYNDKFLNDNRAVFKPFSFGTRDCLGKNLAYSELRVIMSRFLYRFDYELVPGQENWADNQRAFVVWEKGPLNISLKHRIVA